MAINLAAKRAAKAKRRKAIVAQKRRREGATGSFSSLLPQAAASPIRQCLLADSVFKDGMGTLILARGGTMGPVNVAVFLLDAYCLGVKDMILQTVDAYQLPQLINRLAGSGPLRAVDPAYARKLLHDLVSWAATFGFQPPREFVAAERLFGSIDPQSCDTTFEFGKDGKPFYIAGPTEPPVTVRRRMNQLLARLGPDGFHYLVRVPSP
jgi:hypothetical protein